MQMNSQLSKGQNAHFQRQNYNTKFKCLICYKHSKNPVLTTCGHMFCWSCLYRNVNTVSLCPYCKHKFLITQCYPIFIDSQENNDSIQIDNIPNRPKAVHKQKILNSNMIGAGMPLSSNNIPNNIVLGKLVTGYSFSPSLAFQSLNNINKGEIIQRDIEESKKFRVKMHLVLIITILMIILYVFQ